MNHQSSWVKKCPMRDRKTCFPKIFFQISCFRRRTSSPRGHGRRCRSWGQCRFGKYWRCVVGDGYGGYRGGTEIRTGCLSKCHESAATPGSRMPRLLESVIESAAKRSIIQRLKLRSCGRTWCGSSGRLAPNKSRQCRDPLPQDTVDAALHILWW